MEDRRLPPLMEYFSEAEDPRRETKNKKYPLIEVIVIVFLAVVSGADGWESIERYGITRKKRLLKFLSLREGIPKHGVYRRALGAIRSGLLYEPGAGHQTGHKAGSDSDRREDDAGDGGKQPSRRGQRRNQYTW